MAHLNSEGGSTGLSISGEQGGTGDHLWEDNWDDDDVEDDFGKALRYAQQFINSSSSSKTLIHSHFIPFMSYQSRIRETVRQSSLRVTSVQSSSHIGSQTID